MFADSGSVDADLDLQQISASIESAFLQKQKTILVKELDDLDIKDAELKGVIQNLPVDEILSYLQALRNAISHHLRLNNKDIKVKDLEIQLL